ncbi:MAG: hypothetical protein A2W91_16065 [Bacteroidetes bacterium GWF2_38_335]|nr:MAG: hypothetical protein A2W91_16065 [Bacteroidetes bacterium GWF2_38_335]OFY81205.1 MAG: hypothetical protein A2281_07040 [Bacteroidetes bacterium RIFOXYA12_FULL_38_20]HBS85321.1 hypothetical protein [Bacteroidales bacterium]
MNFVFKILLFTCLLPLFSKSQNSSVDSLKRELKTSFLKAKLHNDLAAILVDSIPETALWHGRQALKFAKKEKNIIEEGNANVFFGEYHYYTGDYDSCMLFYNKALKIFEKESDYVGTSTVLNNIGAVYYQTGEYDRAIKIYGKTLKLAETNKDDKGIGLAWNNLGSIRQLTGENVEALKCFEKSLEIKKKIKDQKGLAYSYNNIAYIHDLWSEYEKAISYYLKSLKISEDLGDKHLSAITYSNIAGVYKIWGNYPKALEYYNISMEIKEEINDQKGIATMINNIGTVKELEKKYSEALSFYEKSSDLFIKVGFKSGEAASYNNIGSVLNKMGDYKKAILYHEKSLAVNTELNSGRGIVMILQNLAKDYLSTGNTGKAMEYIRPSISKAKEINEKSLLSDSYKILSDIYLKNADFKSAYTYYKNHTELKDSLFNETKHQQVSTLQTRFETEQKEKEIVLLENEKEITSLEMDKKNASLESQREKIKIYLAALVMIIIFSGVLFMMYLQKQKSYKILLKKNIEIVEKEKELEKIRPPEVITREAIIHQEEIQIPEDKYSSSTLNQEQKNQLVAGLSLLMDEEKFYLNPQLTIEEVSENLGSNRRYVSQAINEEFKMNFSNFINEYRVKEARRLLLSPDFANLTLEAIASKSGFHSRATFITAFKKFTGLTPSYFQKSSK